MIGALYAMGRDMPLVVAAFGWAAAINGAWALAWALARWGR